jgi:hypothetical protein
VEINNEGSREKIIKNIEKRITKNRWTHNDGKKGNRKEESKDRR